MDERLLGTLYDHRQAVDSGIDTPTVDIDTLTDDVDAVVETMQPIVEQSEE